MAAVVSNVIESKGVQPPPPAQQESPVKKSPSTSSLSNLLEKRKMVGARSKPDPFNTVSKKDAWFTFGKWIVKKTDAEVRQHMSRLTLSDMILGQ